MSKQPSTHRFQLFDVKKDDLEYELMMENRAIAAPKSKASIINSKVIVDGQEDKKFLVTAEYLLSQNRDFEQTVSSDYHVWEVLENKAVLLDKSAAARAINVSARDLQGLNNAVVDPSQPNEILRDISDVLSDENLYKMMDDNSHRLAQEAGEFSTNAPDSRTRLKGHTLLDEKIAAYKDEQAAAISVASERFEMILNDTRLSGDIDDSELALMIDEHDNLMSEHRDKLMQASLNKTGFLVVNDRLLDAKEAREFTELSFTSVARGKFMELGDIESRMMVGVGTNREADRIIAELGREPLDDKLIRLIVLKEKGSQSQTNIYLVEDIDQHLWIRADQTNSQGDVISRNKESFEAIGINADHLTQGVSSTDGLESREALAMRMQLTANHLRRMVSDEQIKAHNAPAIHQTPRPTPRAAVTSVEKHIDRNFVIERLDIEQEESFPFWGITPNSDLEDEQHVKSVWRVIDRRSGDIAILADVDASEDNKGHQDNNKVVLKYLNKSGDRSTGDGWLDGVSMHHSGDLNEDDIKKGLEGLERFDVWEDLELRMQFEAMVKGHYGLKKGNYPYFGEDEEEAEENEKKPVVYGKMRKPTFQQ